MSLCLTNPGREKSLNKIPGDGWSDSSAAHTKNVHVVVFDTLPCRKVIVN